MILVFFFRNSKFAGSLRKSFVFLSCDRDGSQSGSELLEASRELGGRIAQPSLVFSQLVLAVAHPVK